MVAPVEAELVSRVVGHVEYGLYASKEWGQIPHSDRVFIGFRSKEKFWLAKKLEEHVGDRRFALRCNDIHVIMNAAVHGYGVAMLPKFVTEGESSLILLDGLDIDWNPPSIW